MLMMRFATGDESVQRSLLWWHYVGLVKGRNVMRSEVRVGIGVKKSGSEQEQSRRSRPSKCKAAGGQVGRWASTYVLCK